MGLRATDFGLLGIPPIDRTSPSGSATATEIVSAWTSNPTKRGLPMSTSMLWSLVAERTRSVRTVTGCGPS
jgi:hypothetical protein